MEENKKLNPNYKYLFVNEEMKANVINNQINEFIEEDEESAKAKIKEKFGDEFYDYSCLGNLINYLLDNSLDKYSIYQDINKQSVVNKIQSLEKEKYLIDTKYKIIEFSNIYRFLFEDKKRQWVDNKEARIYLYLIQEIERRTGDCHNLSVSAAKILLQCFDIKTDVVTGYNAYFTSKNRYLHSWNEFDKDGEEYVIDSTMNVVMDKTSYYLIKHTDESQIVERVKAEDIVQDFKDYKGLIEEIDLKTYLTSRKRIIEDLERNKHLFRKKDGEEREI